MWNKAMPKKILFALFWAASSSAMGACPDKTNMLWNYEGSIAGKFPIMLTLSMGRDKIEGEYFYVSQLKDIALRGELREPQLRLEELDAAGRVTAHFDGTVDRDCEKFEGTWRKVGAGEGMPFQVKLTSGVGGTLDSRYGGDEALIHRNAERFWQAVKRRDKKTVAALVVYPVKVSVNGRPVKVRNAADFIAAYDDIFSNAYRNAIAEAVPHNMFSKNGMAMLGRGEVWFNGQGKVAALNNY